MSSFDAILAKHTTAGGQDTKDKVLGASFVVVNKDGILYSGSAGRIDHAPDSSAWSADSFTWVASLTKIITSASFMQLVEQGLIGLDDDLRSLVPQLGQMQILKGFDNDEKPILEDHDTPVTPRMLLTHTVGLGYDLADEDLMRWHKAIGRKTTNLNGTLEGFTTPLKFKPGEGWFYGTATDWLGHALEKITGKSLGQYMTENIFEPLGMNDTGFWPKKMPHTAERKAAWAYRGEDGSRLAPGAMPVAEEREMESGGAGLWTTAQDYGKFLSALMANRLVKKETLDEICRPQLNEQQAAMLNGIAFTWGAIVVEFSSDIPVNHGLGGCINMRDVPGKRKKGSIMWSGMANSRWWMDRESGVAAVMVTQVLPPGDPVSIKLYDELERAVYKEFVQQA
ncbi:beta-lactamase [Colletotrichum sojae]|uniref:Beta-lactamase n=1 Tax=Colletotrichum sojae TaxID=2175907 RepID=A0A8H6N164_9PEZI|nr:beta-lactamase [Colletotrichum sojae]